MSSYEFEQLDGEGETVQVRLAGEVDLTNVGELEERLTAIAPPEAQLVLDLNRVVFVDSAALHLLFKLARRQEHGKLALVVDPTASIARVMAIVGLAQAARIVASTDELSST
ncbi:MAG: STAS domain-containing protein [Gaiellaceae bacterium]